MSQGPNPPPSDKGQPPGRAATAPEEHAREDHPGLAEHEKAPLAEEASRQEDA